MATPVTAPVEQPLTAAKLDADGQPPTLDSLLAGRGVVQEAHFERLLTSTTDQGGPVEKEGMLSMQRWCVPTTKGFDQTQATVDP